MPDCCDFKGGCIHRPAVSELDQLRAENERLRAAQTVTVLVPPMPESELITYLRRALEEAHQTIGLMRQAKHEERDWWRRRDAEEIRQLLALLGDTFAVANGDDTDDGHANDVLDRARARLKQQKGGA